MLKYMESINATLKRLHIIRSSTASDGEYSTATGATASGIFTARTDIQNDTDVVLQLWQEAVSQLYSLAIVPPLVSTATVILVADTREYSLPDDFERVAGKTTEERVLRGATTAFVLKEYPGGYLKMLADQPVATDWSGDPQKWAISPNDGSLRVDREPTTTQDGNVYNMAYEKRLALTGTMGTSTLPFSDTVAEALVSVVAEGYRAERNKSFSGVTFRNNLARAFAMIRPTPPSTRYGVRRASN